MNICMSGWRKTVDGSRLSVKLDPHGILHLVVSCNDSGYREGHYFIDYFTGEEIGNCPIRTPKIPKELVDWHMQETSPEEMLGIWKRLRPDLLEDVFDGLRRKGAEAIGKIVIV